MDKTENAAQNSAIGGGFSFQISNNPVVETRRAPEQPKAADGKSPDDVAILADDTLHLLARDPRSLFVYWNLDWPGRFAAANLSARPVHLRIFREDEGEETTIGIDPEARFSFVEVSRPEASYRCEMGCFEGDDWRTLARSATAETPAAAMSENPEARFATVPLHLSFHRLIQIFRVNGVDKVTLSESIADMHAKARLLADSMSPEDWSEFVGSAESAVNAGAALGLSGVDAPELAALLRSVKDDSVRQMPSLENLARWRWLGERFGGSSWSGGSSERNGNLGGSSYVGSS